MALGVWLGGDLEILVVFFGGDVEGVGCDGALLVRCDLEVVSVGGDGALGVWILRNLEIIWCYFGALVIRLSCNLEIFIILLGGDSEIIWLDTTLLVVGLNWDDKVVWLYGAFVVGLGGDGEVVWLDGTRLFHLLAS